MISIFTLPKGFRDPHTNLTQRNAIQSWMYLDPSPEIILLGDDPGVSEVVDEYSLVHAPQIEMSPYGNPLIRSLFEVGQETASNGIVCYLSCDVIVSPNFQECVLNIANQFKKFLTLAQRWDIDIDYAIDFTNDNWIYELSDDVVKRGKLHPPWAIDFYGFRKGLWSEIPSFAIGRPGWDNYLVTKALDSGTDVADISSAILLTHQNHPVTTGYAPEDPDAVRHVKLMGDIRVSGVNSATHRVVRIDDNYIFVTKGF